MKPAAEITDRAKRYRANRQPPPGPRTCNFCAVRKNVDIDHISGDESDGDQQNLFYLCRPCNVRKGIVQSRNRIGIRTRQYNPGSVIRTLKEWKHKAAVMLGLTAGDVTEATAAVRNTAPERRAEFGRQIAANRARNPEAPTFEQYVHAVTIHQHKAHDEGGRIIHATPRALRSEYAQRIADIKRQRRGEVPF